MKQLFGTEYNSCKFLDTHAFMSLDKLVAYYFNKAFPLLSTQPFKKIYVFVCVCVQVAPGSSVSATKDLSAPSTGQPSSLPISHDTIR